MYILFLKSEKPGHTALDFVGVYLTKEDAVKHADKVFGSFEPSGFGNHRMLQARDGMAPQAVWATQALADGDMIQVSYVLAKF